MGKVGLDNLVKHGFQAAETALSESIQHNGINVVNIVLPGRGCLTDVGSLKECSTDSASDFPSEKSQYNNNNNNNNNNIQQVITVILIIMILMMTIITIT